MKNFLNFLVLILLIISGVWFYRKQQDKKRRQRELEEKEAQERETERLKLFNFFTAKIADIKQANDVFVKNSTFKNGYFSNYQLTQWFNQFKNLWADLQNQRYKDIGLVDAEVFSIGTFLSNFDNCDDLRDKYNKSFVKQELLNYGTFFNSIEGRKLDLQQRTAIITDDDNSLVIAGAGSGKTTTIVGKTKYVIDRYGIAPEEILLISFTNKSATTLAQRIDTPGVVAKTFHKFGMDLIAEVTGKKPSIFDENQFKPLLKGFFNELIQDGNYLQKVTEYFTNFLKRPKSQFEFETQGDYIQYLKDQNFRTYKLVDVPVKGRQTYRMEVVKSIEECKIANFLLFNGVEYQYEFPYEVDTADQQHRQYKPDFLITQNGRKVYLEHFAVGRNGNVPPFFVKEYETPEIAKSRYWDKINWARQLHNENNTTLIETYSYEMNEGILFANLTEKLNQCGIILRPKTPEQIWSIISKAAQDEVNGFLTLFGTFISLMKSNNYSVRDISKRNSQVSDDFTRKRNDLFIQIIKPIFEKYEEHLRERKEIDFNDMINSASNLISNGKFQREFKYIIVDEFQDISIGRYTLLKAIKSKNPDCKLFCVGDDWQSIYRFTGSDISLFKDFEKYFGFTVKSKIETTYRFYDPIIRLSSDFIQKNPNQAKKQLKGASTTNTTGYQLCYSIDSNQDDTLALRSIFDELILTDPNIASKEIIILGRYSFDIDRIKNEQRIFRINKEEGQISYSGENSDRTQINLTAQFMTVHKAKGLEAQIVVVINCNSGKFGFPSEMSDDPILNLLLSDADQFENGEERRLFYVAMTRAKERIFFVADSNYKSKFIAELEIESGETEVEKCPNCRTADIVLRKTGTARNGNTYKFYGCSNYLYGCDYTTTVWENYN